LERTADLDEKGVRYLNEINVAADRMLEMINHLLQSVTKTELLILKREPCDLEELIRRVMEDIEGVALEKMIELAYTCQGEPYQVLGDEMRLYHMILNLVDNALKYSPKNTQITITTRFSEKLTQIVICDEGPGIPEKDLPHVFERYYRGIQGSLKVAQGSGVGLATVKNIVEAHGGTVAVNNGEERGTIFNITLPGSMRIEAAPDTGS